MEQKELIPHIFRSEFSRITSVLCRHFGLEHMEMAEDIASDTFLSAMETWSYKGIPENPVAWLHTVARNKARNEMKRNSLFKSKIVSDLHHSSKTREPEIDLSEKNITDSQLQMLFAICHPSVSTEGQIALALRILCGFGIEEIANAFLTGKETIHKRISRAKEVFRNEKLPVEFPGKVEMQKRVQNVLITIYLLFSEGYYSESRDPVLREDLCLEAMRLTYLLIETADTNLPEVNALLSLMCFHASRFEARKNKDGRMVLYQDQDESIWNEELISKGNYYLHLASQSGTVSKYHIEAGIAYWHTVKEDSKEKWENILQLYNRLLQVEYSQVAALNRSFALAKANGRTEGIAAAEKLNLTNNQYYYTLLGELYTGLDTDRAKMNYEKALKLARSKTDKQIIQENLEKLIKDE